MLNGRISHWLEVKSGPMALLLDCLLALVRPATTPKNRFLAFIFVVFFSIPGLLIPLIGFDPDRVGIVWLYVVSGVVWLLVTEAPGAGERRAKALHLPERSPSKALLCGVLLIYAVELACGLSVILWGQDAPDPVRAIRWGILLPVGVADLIGGLIGGFIVTSDGLLIYRPE